eukprot:3635679-Prymnesium_polylepis.2
MVAVARAPRRDTASPRARSCRGSTPDHGRFRARGVCVKGEGGGAQSMHAASRGTDMHFSAALPDLAVTGACIQSVEPDACRCRPVQGVACECAVGGVHWSYVEPVSYTHLRAHETLMNL